MEELVRCSRYKQEKFVKLLKAASHWLNVTFDRYDMEILPK